MKRQRIDKSALAFPVPKRVRCPAHLDWIRMQPCCVPGCRSRVSEPHHLLDCPEPKGRSIKAGDNWTAPLCGGPGPMFGGSLGGHHRGQDSPHHSGNETAWAARHGIDLVALAKWYWANSPANPKGKADV